VVVSVSSGTIETNTVVASTELSVVSDAASENYNFIKLKGSNEL
jgi:hypothetical protein